MSPNHVSPDEQFRAALAARGIIPPAELIADGHIHRCDAEGRNGRNDASYLLHLDGIPAGGFENWHDGRGWQNWRTDLGREFTAEEKAAHTKRARQTARAREQEDARRKAEARDRAAMIWEVALPANDDHPYLRTKSVRPHGIRETDNRLVIPLRDHAGQLHSLQFITADGKKRFLAGGRKSGCYFAIGKPDGALCIAEGFATGASIHEATGHAVAVAFDAGNLVAVAKALRAKFPALQLIACADDDFQTNGNPGLTKAKAAARAVGGYIAVPDFGDNRPSDATDFNDLHKLRGAEAVENAVRDAISVEPPHRAGDHDEWVPDTREYILIPGLHTDHADVTHEIGTDAFTNQALDALPPGVLYRWDWVVGELVGAPGALRFCEMSEHRLRPVVDGHVKLSKWVKRDEDQVRVFVPCARDTAALVLAAAGVSPRVRELKLLTRYPVYAPGFVLTSRGWNESSGIFYDEPAALRSLVPSPDPDLEVLNDLVVDFPFKDDASKYNVFGMMLTLLVRPALDSNTPFHLVLASMERTGKGKLLESVLGCAILGQDLPTMQLGSTEEEREKRITSLILEGTTAVHIDNLSTEEVLNSAALASLATSRVWKGRKLGTSKMPVLPNNLVVGMSGNNVRASAELVKRTVPIVLQPLDDHPEDRAEFVHPYIESYARERRRLVLETLTGMVEAWKAAGMPGSDRRMGGFEGWVQTIGGILAHAGITDWMANYKTWVRRGDELSADATELITAWYARYGTAEVTATEILQLVKQTGTFPHVTSRPESGQLVSLARRVLTPLTDRPVGEWIVVRIGSGGSSRYRLEEALPI